MSTAITKVDAVIIVAIIAGTLSFITSLIVKWVDYRRAKREYLTQKREKAYYPFLLMI